MPETDTQTSAPVLGALIDALGSGGRIDPAGLLRAQLQNQLPEDPQVSLLLRLLEKREQQAAAESHADVHGEESDEDEDEEIDEPAKAQALGDLKDKIDRVYAELEALRARNDALAAALGSCYLCFGEDPLCDECQGRGVPGSRRPDPETFRQYVLPAYRRAKQIEAAASGLPRTGEQ